ASSASITQARKSPRFTRAGLGNSVADSNAPEKGLDKPSLAIISGLVAPSLTPATVPPSCSSRRAVCRSAISRACVSLQRRAKSAGSANGWRVERARSRLVTMVSISAASRAVGESSGMDLSVMGSGLPMIMARTSDYHGIKGSSGSTARPVPQGAHDDMEHEFWLQRWREGETRFHQERVMPLLQKYWPTLALPAG